MLIYIDESGSFVPLERRRSRVSAIAALFFSSKVADDLCREFTELTRLYPTVNGEVKGSRLNETQVASVIMLLERYNALVEAQVIDTGWHRNDEIRAFRMRQADLIGKHAISNPDHRVRDLAGRLKRHVEAMSNQLFIQAWMTLPLVERVIQTAIWYYSLQAPTQLRSFNWTVDAKAAGDLTPVEEFWSKFVVPYAQHQSQLRPIGLLYDGDHSEMRHYMTIDASGQAGTLSISDILTDHLAFKDSVNEPALQMADIIANAITRAFNGSLDENGWERLPYLLAGPEPQVIQYGRMQLVARGRDKRIPLSGRHAQVMERLYAKRRLVHQG